MLCQTAFFLTKLFDVCKAKQKNKRRECEGYCDRGKLILIEVHLKSRDKVEETIVEYVTH